MTTDNHCKAIFKYSIDMNVESRTQKLNEVVKQKYLKRVQTQISHRRPIKKHHFQTIIYRRTPIFDMK